MIIGRSVLCRVRRGRGPGTGMSFDEACFLGLIPNSTHFRFNNGSLYVAAVKAAVNDGKLTEERLSYVLKTQRWMRRLKRAFAKRGFSRTTRKLVLEYQTSLV